MTNEETLKLALEALKIVWEEEEEISAKAHQVVFKAIKALEESLKQEHGEPVAKAWAEGYRMGIADERTSEANIGIAGFNAKVEPDRQNPYGIPQPKQEQGEPVAWIWKYANGEEEVVFVSPRHIDATHVDAPSTITPLYAHPQQRKPLTDEQIAPMFENRQKQETIGEKDAWYFYAWGVSDGEAAHGIK